MLDALGRTAMALLIGATGGALFALIGAPLPWPLGAIATSALAAIFLNRCAMPVGTRSISKLVVGVLAGSAFTPDIAASMLGWWPSVLTVAVYSLAISVAGYLLFSRVMRYDPVTAYFAATPGGLGEFTLLGSALGGQVHTLVLIHAMRVITIVFGIPIMLQISQTPPFLDPGDAAAGGHGMFDWLVLIGCGLGGHLLGRIPGFPGGSIVGAMLLSAALHATGLTSAAPPMWVVALAQILIGSLAGARFGGVSWSDARRDLGIAVVWALVLLGVTLAMTSVAAPLLGMSYTTMLLALAPGGVSEMIIISYALGADVALVAFCQALRIFLVLALAPLFFNILARRRRAPGAPPT